MFLTLQQLLLIALLHQQQQLASHGAWATRTTATRAATPPATPPPTAVPLAAAPLVSSSEATLLTTHRLFPAPQMQPLRRYEETDEVDNGPAAGAATAPEQLTAAAEAKADGADGADGGGGGNKRYSIVSVYTNCTRDLFAMNIELNRGFRGLVYAKDFPLECRARGTAHTNVTLRLPTSGCGVRVEPRADGNMELSVRVMLQMELKLRQSSDILRTVRCKLPPNAMGMMVIQPTTTTPATTTTTESTRPNVYEGVGPQNYRNGRMRVLATNTVNATAATAAAAAAAAAATATGQGEDVSDNSDTSSAPQTEEFNESQILQQTTAAIPPSQQQQQQQQQRDESQTTTTIAPKTTTAKTTATPRVRIWLELGGLDGSGAVEVGQPTTLTVRAIVPGTMGVRVVDCAALDGLGESKQQLLDERGCTIDEQVMPPLSAHFKPAEEGWSKQQVDDLVEKIFSATFPAFKFPDRERLHVSCGVQLCKGKCPNVNCRTTEKLNLSADKHLARIEVFNSLAVTAPQIEVDRLRYNRHYNMSVEEYPPHVRPVQSEGTLCLSVSKLAISFCVLGLIFLLAVVVAIFSLIRSRRRAALACTLRPSDSGGRLQRAEVCTSMFSSSSESAHSARFGSKLFIPYYPNTLPYGRVY